MEKLYMLPIDNEENINERIKKLQNALVGREYRIYRSGMSLAIYITEEEEQVINNIKEVESQKLLKYEEFIYRMKSIARSNTFK